MGAKFRKIFKKSKEERIVMVGLDNAGKSTILYRLKLGHVENTKPTVGFNVEQIKYHNLTLTIWDVGGQDQIRMFWKHYFINTKAIIYVVDSNDNIRLKEAKEEFWKLMDSPELSKAAFLIFANKQDLPNAAKKDEIAKLFELEKLKNPWHIQGASALKGEGIEEGFDYIAKIFEESRKNKK
eukprot:TRINITY_DN244_c1_g1_i1.p1 TRINITY_DN244_c1_g1~~TRINITY_DN244_c1_g1_i1.p1  ORF type:complete len:182 (+),score=46.38 TRINITY_DN244_c1_g1_i1:66-611(+)